jgi:aerobic-type carbon monoxide dehydrogenase small subunit (CoxS/CutS family)
MGAQSMQDAAADAARAMTLTVNGQTHALKTDPFRPLSDTLREELGLKGTKVGCEAGDCGACTVLLDGAQVCACLVPTAQAENCQIETVEGGGPEGLTDLLRHAFLAHGAAQCGICTPGMLMAATDLLARQASPSWSDVEAALGGVLCRCTGYTKIIEAVLAVAVPAVVNAENAAAAQSDVQHPVGQRLPRLDGWGKVAGSDLFGADEAPADALWMRVVRSPHARARFSFGDLETLRRSAEGLAAILTSRTSRFWPRAMCVFAAKRCWRWSAHARR